MHPSPSSAVPDALPGLAADPLWWRGATLYQIYPRSFRDANGDGIGDLPGVLAGLEHVASLGVDGIWLSPFFPSPMRDFGYDVAEYCDVDPIFGNLADFDRVVARAHALGLRVVIDQVWGHSSDEHPWFRSSRAARSGPHADWYVWADPKPDGTPPNNWLSVFGGPAWSWEPRRRQYYLHHFLPSQPSFDLENPSVLDALSEAALFWLDRGVDGFRFDAIDFLAHDRQLRDNPPAAVTRGAEPHRPFGWQLHLHDMRGSGIAGVISRMRGLLDFKPGAASLGEVSSQEGAFGRVAAYTTGDDRLHMAYTLRLLRGPVTPAALRAALGELAAAGPEGWPCWAISNHDAVRAASRSAGVAASDRPAFARLLLAVLVALRGTLCLYQGDELGLTEAVLPRAALRDPFGIAFWPDFAGRDGSRTPLPWDDAAPDLGFGLADPWLPVPAEHRALAVAAQERDPGSTLNALRRLLEFRRREPALRTGALALVDAAEPFFAVDRSAADRRLRLVANFSDAAATLPPALVAGWRPVPLAGFLPAGDALPPWGAAFFER